MYSSDGSSVHQVTVSMYEMCGECVYRCVRMKKPRLQLRAFTVGGRIFTQFSSEVNGHGDPEGHGNDNKPADDLCSSSASLYAYLEKSMN